MYIHYIYGTNEYAICLFRAFFIIPKFDNRNVNTQLIGSDVKKKLQKLQNIEENPF